MKKNLFLGWMLFAVAISFAACTNVNEPEPDPDPIVTGDGTKTKPYSVAEIITLNPQSTTDAVKTAVWTKGFIVGYYNSTPNPAIVEAAAPFTDDFNIMMAAKATETDKTKMLSIQLPAGALRTALGLKTTPANFGKEILIHGDIMKYNTFPGVKNTNGYWFVAANTGLEPVIDTDVATGDGTEASPYNVAGAKVNQGSLKWIEGYVVGNVDGTGMDMTTESKFVAPFTVKTNILLASKAGETDFNKCFAVQLPAGAVRDGLNLGDNATNLGKKVKMYGSLEAYFGKPGIKNTTYFELEGGKTGGTKPQDVSNAILTETLLTQSSFDKFSKFSVLGDQMWTFSALYGAVMSGFLTNTSYANEDWLITPAMNLSGKTNIKLAFDHARGPAGSITIGINEGYYTVWVSNNYNSGDPTTASWTEITGVIHGTTAWGYVSSGNLTIPTANLNANTKIAFKYKSINGASATWEIKNVLVK